MTRLVTSAFEMQQLSAVSDAVEGQGFATAGGVAPQIDTSIVRSGRASIKVNVDTTTATSIARWQLSSSALDRSYYLRVYVYLSGAPVTGNLLVAQFANAASAVQLASLRINTDLTVSARGAVGGVVQDVSNASIPLSVTTGTFIRLELRCKITTAGTTGEIEARVDGVTVPMQGGDVYVGDLGTSPVAVARFGKINANNSGNVPAYLTEIAVNDDQGADDNSWIGDTRIALLRPIGDSARVGWTGGAGATTGLYQGVDNVPPIGVDVASATDATQIVDANSNVTDTYDVQMQTYQDAGILSGDVIRRVQAIAQGGYSAAVGHTLTVRTQSNPGPATEGTLALGAIAAGVSPLNWRTVRDVEQLAPSVALGASPVVRLRRASATADVVTYDFVGLYVEYERPLQYLGLKAGLFDPVVVKKAWFDPTAVSLGRFDADFVGSTDTTAPISALVSESRTRVSAVSGFSSVDIVWSANEGVQAWMFRVVGAGGADHNQGTLIKQASGVSIASGVPQTTTITEAELAAASPGDGDKLVKLFVQDVAGNWSV